MAMPSKRERSGSSHPNTKSNPSIFPEPNHFLGLREHGDELSANESSGPDKQLLACVRALS